MNYFHITWVTHNSRISERMIEYKIKTGEKIILNLDDRKLIAKILKDLIKEFEIKILVYNVLSDHIHIVVGCMENEVPILTRKLKSKSTYLYKKSKNIDVKFNLWGQKSNTSIIKSEKELINVVGYVKNNHMKHNLTDVII